jgi:hypothetical protein
MPGCMALISERHLGESQVVESPDFDAFQEECYLATAMLTRT